MLVLMIPIVLCPKLATLSIYLFHLAAQVNEEVYTLFFLFSARHQACTRGEITWEWDLGQGTTLIWD